MNERETWEAQGDDTGRFVNNVMCTSGNGYLVAQCSATYSDPEKAWRNTQKIAAVNNLIEACEALPLHLLEGDADEFWQEYRSEFFAAMRFAKKALAKVPDES